MIELSNEEFEMLTSFIKVNYGLDLAARKSFVQMRLQKLIQENNFTTFTDYFTFACSDITGVAISDLVSRMTVNYTLFYRESYHFDYLTNEVLPKLCQKEQFSKDLRIWSAGCSTGEEPYTLAMILFDFLGVQKNQWDMKILATDISTFALKKAVVGAYPVDSVECLNPLWVKRYFEPSQKDPELVNISPRIKEEVIFRKLNLVGDSFNFRHKFHFIFCRNVMIYFDEPTRNNLIRKFYDILDDGGYLFIGMSETIDKDASKFKYIMPSVYRKEL